MIWRESGCDCCPSTYAEEALEEDEELYPRRVSIEKEDMIDMPIS